MIFNVLMVSKSPAEYTNANGTFQPYTLWGTFDGNSDPEYAVIHKKPESAPPRQGDSIECTVDPGLVDVPVKDKMLEIKRIRGVSSGGRGSQSQAQRQAPRPSAPSNPSQNAQHESPDRQGSIERQNSLTNAVALCVARSEVSLAQKQYDDAAGQLTEENVVSVAAQLALYNAGKPDNAITLDSVEDMFADDPGPVSPF